MGYHVRREELAQAARDHHLLGLGPADEAGDPHRHPQGVEVRLRFNEADVQGRRAPAAIADGSMTEADVYAEIGEVCNGSKSGREGDELIVVDLTGTGAQDAAIGQVAWGRWARHT